MSNGHTLTGNIQHHAAFQSRILENERDILVYLPPGYRRGKQRRYPVLYLHDGQNVFDAATAFGGVEWQVDETAQHLIRNRLIEPLIIVAGSIEMLWIRSNMGEERVHEYTPTRARLAVNGSAPVISQGRLRQYGQFLVEELKPFIDRTYRTRPEKKFTGVGGSSLGGLASLILGFWFPEVFTRIAALSPSIWWDDCVVYRLIDEMEDRPRSSLIWLDTGTNEEGWERAGGVRERLQERGWRLYGDLHYLEIPGGEHSEAAWGNRVEAVLRFLYPPAQSPGKKSRPKPAMVRTQVVRTDQASEEALRPVKTI